MRNLDKAVCIVLKSDSKRNNEFDNCLAKLSMLKNINSFERLVHTNYNIHILFCGNYNSNWFEVIFAKSFKELEKKFNCEYNITMHYLGKSFRFSKNDYKWYRSNILRNNGFIGHYQNTHHDYVVTQPNIIFKVKIKYNQIIEQFDITSYSFYNYRLLNIIRINYENH